MEQKDEPKLLIEKEWKAELAALRERLDGIQTIISEATGFLLENEKADNRVLVVLMATRILCAPPNTAQQMKQRGLERCGPNDVHFNLTLQLIQAVEDLINHKRRQVLEA